MTSALSLTNHHKIAGALERPAGVGDEALAARTARATHLPLPAGNVVQESAIILRDPTHVHPRPLMRQC
jgi:hypothetical protein